MDYYIMGRKESIEDVCFNHLKVEKYNRITITPVTNKGGLNA